MKCIICGKEIEKSMYMNAVLCSQKCFEVNFWNETLDEDAIIVRGTCYHDGGRKPSGYGGFLGFGGARYLIQMDNGKLIDTNNLWCNGDVPEERNVSDNAKFLTVEEYNKLIGG